MPCRDLVPPSTRPRQRFRDQVRERQRHGLGERQLAAHEGHLPHGHPGHGQELLPVQHPGTADLVRDPRDARRPTPRAPAAIDIMVAMNAETYAKDVREVASGGYPDLRLDLAAQRRSCSARTSPCSACRSPRLCNENFDGVRNAHPDEEHRYAGVLAALLDLDLELIARAARPRATRKSRSCSTRNIKAHAAGLRLREGAFHLPACRCGSRRWTRPRGHILIDGNTAAGAGLRVCRRHRGGVVSDHAVDLADGCLQELLRALPRRSRDRRAQLRGHPGGG